MNAVRGQIAPVRELRARGVTVGLGIDNMFGDVFELLRACVLVARIRDHDGATMQAAEALELATLGGARALGMVGETGSIEVGKRADLVVLDCRGFGLTPTLEPVPSLVYHAHGRDVDMVRTVRPYSAPTARGAGSDTTWTLGSSRTAWAAFVQYMRNTSAWRSVRSCTDTLRSVGGRGGGRSPDELARLHLEPGLAARPERLGAPEDSHA
jgi:hypothetical protein